MTKSAIYDLDHAAYDHNEGAGAILFGFGSLLLVGLAVLVALL